jgi:hypothetical protein
VSNSTDNQQTPETAPPKCHVRRHLTPSEFMTYDVMRAMAKPLETGSGLYCYAKLTTIANYNNLSTDQNARNIESLIKKEWLIEVGRPRWRAGRFGSNRYQVVTHDEYLDDFDHEFNEPCPPFKYDKITGEKFEKLDKAEARDFSIKMDLRKWLRKNLGWLRVADSALAENAEAIRDRLRQQADEEALADALCNHAAVLRRG